jgi:DNA-directed RNA polymerase subunit RPC12/RpoP
MATTIAISCPKCEKEIKAPAELAGKKIRCKECLHVFLVKAPAAAAAGKTAAKGDKPAKAPAGKPAKAAAPPKPEPDDTERDDTAYGVTDHSFLPRCAYCAKEMEEGQVVCLNCGYNHRTRERPAVQKTYEPTGGEWFLHLLPGILCALLVLLALSIITEGFLFRAEKEAAWEGAFVNPYMLGIVIWRAVLWLFIGFFAGRFAIKRLILHRRPPEREMVKKKD